MISASERGDLAFGGETNIPYFMEDGIFTRDEFATMKETTFEKGLSAPTLWESQFNNLDECKISGGVFCQVY